MSAINVKKSYLQNIPSSEINKNLDCAKNRGAIFTRNEIVNFILDLIGYTSNEPLYEKKILEPSFGNGDFLFPIIERLLNSFKSESPSIKKLINAIRAVELHDETFYQTKSALIDFLSIQSFSYNDAKTIADSWLIKGDFLTFHNDSSFDYIAGNPPYIRQERIDSKSLAYYKRHYHTMRDRADIYVIFYENALKSLKAHGILGFICSDRWMKNRYGEQLRSFISTNYHLKTYVDMVGADAFQKDVIAYTGVTIISKSKPAPTKVAKVSEIDKEQLKKLYNEITIDSIPSSSIYQVSLIQGTAPWVFDDSEQTSLLRRIENHYPLIESTGCKIGIGVATGADKVFIVDYENDSIERDCLVPLVQTTDIKTGKIIWRHKAIINPFAEDGNLVKLEHYPKLKKYFEDNENALKKRHCAQRGNNWYRTIDRIWPDLTGKAKLLIPDIKGEAHIVYDSGKYYPHHNLYYVTSNNWELYALQAVLLSNMTRFFISSYSTQMRGGYFRFQAQYLRRLRIPMWEDVSVSMQNALIEAGKLRHIANCNDLVCELYNLSATERKIIIGE
ncbi:Eco57I restriction-modification methylase domain-containing protein [bacterium]|nr:Eco57I restriction-modification methylase domain-containing protein [bacterium]